MAHVSGGIMAMYISQGVEARHLLSAVIMTSPGTILVARCWCRRPKCPPQRAESSSQDELHKEENLIGAIARGTIDGGKLAMNVAIMLISFLALVALLDMLLTGSTAAFHGFQARWDKSLATCSRPLRG